MPTAALLADSEDEDASHQSTVASLSLLEARAKNLKRHKEFLSALHLKYETHLGGAAQQSDQSEPKRRKVHQSCSRGEHRRGMLISNAEQAQTVENLLSRLHEQYPLRQRQLRRLLGLLTPDRTTSQAQQRDPASIFVTGAAGTGKTTAVRHVIRTVETRHENCITCYVNCSVDAASTDGLSRAVYRQFESAVQMKESDSAMKRDSGVITGSVVTGSDGDDSVAADEQPAQPILVPSASERSDQGSSRTSLRQLGRDLRGLVGMRFFGVLVLDNADCVMRLGQRTNDAEWNNLLAELLLLPTAVGLNVTVVVISRSTMLAHTVVGSLDSLSLGCMTEAIDPLFVRFPAYSDKSSLRRVLRQPSSQRLIVGGEGVADLTSGFESDVYYSFVDTLIQSAQGTTVDVKELIGMGRSLWPHYILPLSAPRCEKTVHAAEKTEEDPSQRKQGVLAVLDRMVLPKVRSQLRHNLFNVKAEDCEETRQAGLTGQVDEAFDMPIRTKYVLLAAFLCQVNTPDRDKHLFSVQKNGRRRTRHQQGDDLASAELVHVSSSAPRPQSFAADRLFALFTSLVSLDQRGARIPAACHKGASRHELESTRFYRALATLRELGLINAYPETSLCESQKLTDQKYWCALSVQEAQRLAAEINLPLDRYMG